MKGILMKTILLTVLLQLTCMTSVVDARVNPIPKVVTVPTMHVAYAEYVGDYDAHPQEFEKLLGTIIEWADSRNLFNFPDETKLVTLLPDETNNTPKDRRRLQMAVNVPKGTKASGQIKTMAIPGGLYGVGRFTVSDDEIDGAWQYMLQTWLPKSGYKITADSLFHIQTNDPDTHPRKLNVIDIYIPVGKGK